MATVAQLEQLEKRLEAEYKVLYHAAGQRIDDAAKAKAAERWHANDLAKAREYRFRFRWQHYEEAGEMSRNERALTHDYEPWQKDRDQDWTALDGDNVEFLREHGLPQTYAECVAEGDTTSHLACYLEARDLITTPDAVPEAQRPADGRVWDVIVEQVAAGEATLWRCDLYTPSVRFADDGRFVRFDHLAYDDEIGLHDTAMAHA